MVEKVGISHVKIISRDVKKYKPGSLKKWGTKISILYTLNSSNNRRERNQEKFRKSFRKVSRIREPVYVGYYRMERITVWMERQKDCATPHDVFGSRETNGKKNSRGMPIYI